MHKLTKAQSARYNHLLDEKRMILHLLDHNYNRRLELLAKRAPAQMLNRYTKDMEDFRLRLAQIESDISKLLNKQYRGGLNR